MLDKKVENQRKGMMKGAVILSVASLLTKVLSAVYKVPFQNLTGDQGFYVYQQVYPIYGIAIALALKGLPLFISKIVSETDSEFFRQDVLKQIISWLSIGAVVVFLFLWGGAGWIAERMGDPELSSVIGAVSYIFLFIPFLATTRGLFQGKLDMVPTGVSQIGEQIMRVIVLLGAAYWYTRSTWSVYEMGTIALHSSWIAGLSGSLILMGFLLKKRRSIFIKGFTFSRPSLAIGKRLLLEGLPITAMASLMVLFQFIDAFTVYNGLLDSGLTEAFARTMKGVYDRGQPLVQLGLVIGLGLSTSLLPLLSRYWKEKNMEAWQDNAASAFKLTILFSGAASIGLIAIMPWMNEALFADRMGTTVLQIYAINIFIASLISCAHSILQSMKQTSILSIVSIGTGLTFKLLMNRFAVRYVGLMGSSYITVVGLLIVFLMLMTSMPKEMLNKIKSRSFLLKTILTFLLVYFITNNSMKGTETLFSIEGRIGVFLLTIIGVIIGGACFILLILKLNLITEKEKDSLPLSKYLRKVG